MKKMFRYLIIIPAVLWCIGLGLVHGVVHSLNFTSAQDTIIQTKTIPSYNRQHCAQYGRAVGCSSADLVTGGCVVRNVCQALGLAAGAACTTLSTLNVESCVIYTTNTAGEDALLQEIANQHLVTIYDSGRSLAGVDFRAGFKAANATNQGIACVAAGQADPCDGP